MAADKGGLKLILADRLIDGNGGPPLQRGAVLLEGDVVKAVGTEEAVVPPEGAEVREFRYDGKTVLPGLIDCHVHLIGLGDGRAGDELTLLPDEVLTLQAARNARAHLYSGTTTVRDLGAKNKTTLMLRQAMEMGITPGPRLRLAGRPMAIIGGHLSYFGIGATGPDECRAAVRQLIKEGVDQIKITATGGSTRTSHRNRPSFNVDELTAICDEAHKFGKHAVAHATSSQGILNVLDAGIDTIVHAVHNEPDGSMVYRPDITERIVKQGVFINPTLHASRHHVWYLEEQAQSRELTEQEQASLESARRGSEYTAECFGKMREAGVTLVCGSDSSWMEYPMGSFQHELEAHVAAGMSPMEAIVSATRDSARSCWIEDEVGTLEPGKQADVLVVDGDPSADINATFDVADVFQAGELVDRGNYV